MLSINYGGQNLSVLFKNDYALRLNKRGFENVEQISCAIVGNDNIPKAVGSAVRSELDTPDDLAGMELALGRALQRLTPNKAVREQFWSAFWRAASYDLGNRTQAAMETLPGYADVPSDPAAGQMQKANTNTLLQFPTNAVPLPSVTSFPPAFDSKEQDIARLQSFVDGHNGSGSLTCGTCNDYRARILELQTGKAV